MAQLSSKVLWITRNEGINTQKIELWSKKPEYSRAGIWHARGAKPTYRYFIDYLRVSTCQGVFGIDIKPGARIKIELTRMKNGFKVKIIKQNKTRAPLTPNP